MTTPEGHRIGAGGAAARAARPLRWIPEGEPTASGAACLAMILELYGVAGAHRARAEVVGASARDLLDGALRLGLPGVAVHVDREDVGALPRGTIVHWEDRFVVLAGGTEGGVTILDPARGERAVSAADAARAFSGVALVFEPSLIDDVEADAPARLAMTDAQRRAFDRDGFFVVEGFLSPAELEELTSAVDAVAGRARRARTLADSEPVTVRNALAHHDALLNWVDHPKLLPIVVDAIGWNIQVRTTHVDHRPPYPRGWETTALGSGDRLGTVGGFRSLALHADFAQSFIFGATSLDERLPFMEIKVGFFLSDMTSPRAGALAVVPGSHLRRTSELRRGIDDAEIRELRVPAGTMLLFRTSVWHAVTPNLSDQVRKVFYIGYQHRFLRPTDYVRQEPALVERSAPIRRQLLGEMGTGRSPLGPDPEFHPSSQYWLPRDDDDVPLRQWAEAALAAREGER